MKQDVFSSIHIKSCYNRRVGNDGERDWENSQREPLDDGNKAEGTQSDKDSRAETQVCYTDIMRQSLTVN